jgi:hypothetical protein
MGSGTSGWMFVGQSRSITLLYWHLKGVKSAPSSPWRSPTDAAFAGERRMSFSHLALTPTLVQSSSYSAFFRSVLGLASALVLVQSSPNPALLLSLYLGLFPSHKPLRLILVDPKPGILQNHGKLSLYAP